MVSDPAADWLPPRAAEAADPPTYDGSAAPGRPFNGPTPASRRTLAGYRGRRGPVALGESLRQQQPPRAAISEPTTAQPAAANGGTQGSTSLGGRDSVRFRQRTRPEPANRTARSALTLAITSLVLLLLTLGQTCILSGPLSGTAWYLAVLARRRVATGELSGGLGMARGAQRLAIVGVVLSVIALIGWAVAFALGYTPQDMSRDLREWRDSLQSS